MQTQLIKNHDAKDVAKQTTISSPAVSDRRTSNVTTVAFQAISKRFAGNWLQISLINLIAKTRIITKQRRTDLQDPQNPQDPADLHRDQIRDQGAKPDLIHLNITGQEIAQETEKKVINLAVSNSC